MNLLNPGVEKIIIYNDSNTYTLSGNDISPSSTLNRRIQTRTASRGGYLPFLIEHTLELKISDASLYDSLQGERFNVFIEKTNGYYVWGVNERLIKEEDLLFDPESEDYPYVIKAKNTSGSPQIGQDGSLLGEFVDLDGNGIADGWTKSGGTVNTFLSGEQTIDEELFYTIDFAYPGSSYVFSLDVSSLHASADNVIEIIFYNGVTQTGANSLTLTTTGSKSVTLVAPANSDNMRVRYGIDNQTAAGQATFSNTKLTIV